MSLATTLGDMKRYRQAEHHFQEELRLRNGNALEVNLPLYSPRAQAHTGSPGRWVASSRWEVGTELSPCGRQARATGSDTEQGCH